jgi:hypothetical protein
MSIVKNYEESDEEIKEPLIVLDKKSDPNYIPKGHML